MARAPRAGRPARSICASTWSTRRSFRRSDLSRLDDIGSERSFNHYPTGWAQVSNTPLKWYKKDTHGGGIRAPLIVHWPGRIKSAGAAVRSQFHHVIDVAPTLYELLAIEAPTQYQGVAQLPIHGVSMAYTFDSDAPTRKERQHFELLGDRAIWYRGWKAVTRPSERDGFRSRSMGTLSSRQGLCGDRGSGCATSRQVARDGRAVVVGGREVRCAAAR